MTRCVKHSFPNLYSYFIWVKGRKSNCYWNCRCDKVTVTNKTWFVIISALFLTFELRGKDWRNYIKSVCLSCLYATNCFVRCGKSHNFSWLHSGKLLLLFLETGSVTLSFISSCWMLLIYVSKMCSTTQMHHGGGILIVMWPLLNNSKSYYLMLFCTFLVT